MNHINLNRENCLSIARLATLKDTTKLRKYLENILFNFDARQLTFDFDYASMEKPSELCDETLAWELYISKFVAWLSDMSQPAPFSIFMKGNSKLPFYAFSNLPLVNCPGAGSCKSWCYSLKAWRYPAAFFRQVQNTILVNTQSVQLTKAFLKLPKNADVRLYVDGDFNSAETLSYWMDLVSIREDLKVYGYSKSWHLFLNYANSGMQFPANYTLNISSGSRFDDAMKAKVMALSCVRGSFSAVELPEAIKQKYHRMAVREVALSAGMKKVFVCPGKCGECMSVKGKNVHACGAQNLMKGTTVVIATH